MADEMFEHTGDANTISELFPEAVSEEVDVFSFGDILPLLLDEDYIVARIEWDEDQLLRHYLGGDGDSTSWVGLLVEGLWTPWTPTYMDMIADDWYVVE